jgi:hypothetical protein
MIDWIINNLAVSEVKLLFCFTLLLIIDVFHIT